MKKRQPEAPPILQIEDLWVSYKTGGDWIHVVRDLSLSIYRGETYGLVGESGCGKSTLALAVMDYLDRNGQVSAGRIFFDDIELRRRDRAEMRALRGQRLSMVYQETGSSLNPAIKIGKQIAEVLQAHEDLSMEEARQQTHTMLKQVRMPDPTDVMGSYPHQLSQGMQQRALLAVALIANPDLLILDEPTTGLDVTTETAVLDLINHLKDAFDMAILYISHDLGVIASVCDRIGVMYAGHLVEEGGIERIFTQPHHPYTRDLLHCVPRVKSQGQRLSPIPGQVPLPGLLPEGCVYSPRCEYARERCRAEAPELLDYPGEHRARCFFSEEIISQRDGHSAGTAVPLQEAKEKGRRAGTFVSEPLVEESTEPLLVLRELRKYFEPSVPFLPFGPSQKALRAIERVSLEIDVGESFALVGESGCGKTTLARCVVGLLEPTNGEIQFEGMGVSSLAAQRPKEMRQQMQIVFQDPQSTLNPQHTVERILSRPLTLFGINDGREREQVVEELLEAVHLDDSYKERFPTQLSGGEKQRVAIARAFAGSPDLVLCDEVVSSLDVSVQASILNLLSEIKKETHCSYLFISHNLGVVRYISDQVGVMYLGELMEVGPVGEMFNPPHHPYTEALLSAVQIPDPTQEHEPILLEGTVPSPRNPPDGCPFHTRCPRKIGDICEEATPPWREGEDGHFIYCHIPKEELEVVQ